MGLNKNYWIKTDFIKQNSVVDVNLEDAIIKPQIFDAQEIELQRILGTKLYETINNKITNNSLTGDYKDLVDKKISLCLMYYALSYGIPFWYVEFGNKGLAKKTSTNSEPLIKEDIIYLTEILKNRAESYGERLIAYLKTNVSKFPEYNQEDEGDIGHESETNFECPIVLGKKYMTDQELNYLNDPSINENIDKS